MAQAEQEDKKQTDAWGMAADFFLNFLIYGISLAPVCFGLVYAGLFAAAGILLMLIPVWYWLYLPYRQRKKCGR